MQPLPRASLLFSARSLHVWRFDGRSRQASTEGTRLAHDSTGLRRGGEAQRQGRLQVCATMRKPRPRPAACRRHRQQRGRGNRPISQWSRRTQSWRPSKSLGPGAMHGLVPHLEVQSRIPIELHIMDYVKPLFDRPKLRRKRLMSGGGRAVTWCTNRDKLRSAQP